MNESTNALTTTTVTLNDRGRGRIVLTVRDGAVVGAMGSEPERFMGRSLDHARHIARYGGNGPKVALSATDVANARTIAKLQRAYDRAHRIELTAVDALGDNATRAQLDRAWALASESNAALRALNAARDVLEMVGAAVFHDGEHGTITEAHLVTYAVPMLRVQFGARVATLQPSEIGRR